MDCWQLSIRPDSRLELPYRATSIRAGLTLMPIPRACDTLVGHCLAVTLGAHSQRRAGCGASVASVHSPSSRRRAAAGWAVSPMGTRGMA